MKFTTLNISGLSLALLGIIDFPVSVYFQIQENDFIFTKVWISIALVIVGAIIIFVDSEMQKTLKYFRISSRLTLFYKFIISLILLGFVLIMILMTVNSWINHKEFLIAWLILTAAVLFIFFYSGIILIKLKFVEFNDKDLIVSNFKQVDIIEIERIIDISKFQFYFYKIKLKDSNGIVQKIFVLSSILDGISTFTIGENESVKKLKKKINL